MADIETEWGTAEDLGMHLEIALDTAGEATLAKERAGYPDKPTPMIDGLVQLANDGGQFAVRFTRPNGRLIYHLHRDEFTRVTE